LIKRREVKSSTAHHDAVAGSFRPPRQRVLLSPELALVDPDLAAAARALLPERRITLPARTLEIRRRRTRSWQPGRRDLTIAVIGLVAGAAMATGITRPGATSVSRPQVAPVVTSPARAPIAVHWTRDGASSYFDFVLWRDGRRVLDAWPTAPNTVVPAAWSYRGKRYELTGGRYAWFVYPGVGPRSEARYGPLTASGQFTVTGR
jgi:hypothetical protein